MTDRISVHELDPASGADGDGIVILGGEFTIGPVGTGGGGSGGGAVTKFKTADESVANATLQADDHLTFPIGANEEWSVTWYLYASCAVASPDLKVLPTAPAGAAMRFGVIAPALGTTSAEASMKNQSLDTATAISAGVPAAATVGQVCVVVTATIENGATGGTVALQWAQNAADAANPVTLKRGSFMVAHEQGGTGGGGGGGGATTLDDLTDVDTTTVAPTDQQTLVFDLASGLWKPGAAAGGTAGGVDGGAPDSTYSDFIDGGTP